MALESRVSVRAVDFVARTKVNRQQLRYFAAGICGLVAVLILTHWLRRVINILSPSSKNPIRSASRFVRHVLVRKLPGFPSIGHALIIAAYLAINLALTFTNVTMTIGDIANRCGWLVTANFCVVVFLALKNTPLAFLTAYSYERINILHQISGYTTCVYLVLHASMYTNYFLSYGRAFMFEEDSVKSGVAAGFAFLGLFLSGVIIRPWWYEAFVAIHILCFTIGLVTASFHQPDLAENGLLIMLAVVAAIWGADRLLRAGRMLLNSVNNYAIIEPLPHGGTRVSLTKKPYGAISGKHCFVWIPAIRKFESHPFTIAATSPMEFVVNAYDGFTRDLHRHALKHPGARLRVSVDGPYGTIPDPLEYDRVVLIAGGSGATFTFGLISNILERMGPGAKSDIFFIWSVKKRTQLSWFADHLQTLKTHPHSPNVTTSLYVSETSSSSSGPTTPDLSDAEDSRERRRRSRQERLASGGSDTPPKSVSVDQEKAPAVVHFSRPHARASDDSGASPALYHHGHAVRAGRPDTAALVRAAVAATPAAGRVLVVACGPDGLLRAVRNVTVGLIRGDGPGVELHIERFGW